MKKRNDNKRNERIRNRLGPDREVPKRTKILLTISILKVENLG